MVSPAQAEENIAGLEIIITDIRNDKGKIIVAVFNRSGPYNAYDYEAARKYGEVEASTAVNGIIKLAMPTLDKGPYVVSLFHDENDNDDFDYDDDWPLEGYGTSNAKDAYHEPTFEEASVEPGRIFVKMYYLD